MKEHIGYAIQADSKHMVRFDADESGKFHSDRYTLVPFDPVRKMKKGETLNEFTIFRREEAALDIVREQGNQRWTVVSLVFRPAS